MWDDLAVAHRPALLGSRTCAGRTRRIVPVGRATVRATLRRARSVILANLAVRQRVATRTPTTARERLLPCRPTSSHSSRSSRRRTTRRRGCPTTCARWHARRTRASSTSSWTAARPTAASRSCRRPVTPCSGGASPTTASPTRSTRPSRVDRRDHRLDQLRRRLLRLPRRRGRRRLLPGAPRRRRRLRSLRPDHRGRRHHPDAVGAAVRLRAAAGRSTSSRSPRPSSAEKPSADRCSTTPSTSRWTTSCGSVSRVAATGSAASTASPAIDRHQPARKSSTMKDVHEQNLERLSDDVRHALGPRVQPRSGRGSTSASGSWARC